MLRKNKSFAGFFFLFSIRTAYETLLRKYSNCCVNIFVCYNCSIKKLFQFLLKIQDPYRLCWIKSFSFGLHLQSMSDLPLNKVRFLIMIRIKSGTWTWESGFASVKRWIQLFYSTKDLLGLIGFVKITWIPWMLWNIGWIRDHNLNKSLETRDSYSQLESNPSFYDHLYKPCNLTFLLSF